MKHICLVLLSFSTMLLLSRGCSEKKAEKDWPLVVAVTGDALSLDPAEMTDAESVQVAAQIFETLVRYKENSTRVEPSLATRWEVSKDGTLWTFYLRKNVKFHDGTPLDADAVILSFERQRDKKHKFHFNDFNYWESTFSNIVETSKKDR
ncbi:MAG: ABC transporter substrate-binding protein, partial [Pseudomonadota bacterium]